MGSELSAIAAAGKTQSSTAEDILAVVKLPAHDLLFTSKVNKCYGGW